MIHTLALENSLGQNLTTGEKEYYTKILVSQDVIDWLNNHDIEINPKGERIYLVNHLRYVYLGLAFSLVKRMVPVVDEDNALWLRKEFDTEFNKKIDEIK